MRPGSGRTKNCQCISLNHLSFTCSHGCKPKIPRSEKIQLIAFDREGNPINKIFSGFTARIFQHEVDHLDGIRFPDRVGENGVLHWVPDNQYSLYLEQWENWPLKIGVDIHSWNGLI